MAPISKSVPKDVRQSEVEDNAPLASTPPLLRTGAREGALHQHFWDPSSTSWASTPPLPFVVLLVGLVSSSVSQTQLMQSLCSNPFGGGHVVRLFERQNILHPLWPLFSGECWGSSLELYGPPRPVALDRARIVWVRVVTQPLGIRGGVLCRADILVHISPFVLGSTSTRCLFSHSSSVQVSILICLFAPEV